MNHIDRKMMDMALPLAPEAMERSQIAHAWMNTLVSDIGARALNMQRIAFSNLQGRETADELQETILHVKGHAEHAGRLALYVYNQHLSRGVETSALAGMEAGLKRLKGFIVELHELGETIDAVRNQPLEFPSH